MFTGNFIALIAFAVCIWGVVLLRKRARRNRQAERERATRFLIEMERIRQEKSQEDS